MSDHVAYGRTTAKSIVLFVATVFAMAAWGTVLVMIYWYGKV